MKVHIENVKQLLAQHRKEKEELGKIITPLLSPNITSKKEILEICQIGKFIYKIDKNIEIVEKSSPPNPDFIVMLNSKLIGLEHTQIQTSEGKTYNRIVSLMSYAEEAFRNLYPNLNVHAKISFVDENIEVKQSKKREIAKEIAEAVHGTIQNHNNPLPSYISKIKTGGHSMVSFSFIEKNWQAPFLTREVLSNEIIRKEKKIELYKKGRKEMEEFWLVCLLGSLSSASYQLNEQENYSFDSKFDRVFLFADFDAKIVDVK